MVIVLCNKIQLITQVLEIVVHGRRGQKKNFGLDASFDDFVHQLAITTGPELSGFVNPAFDVVSKVMRLVDDKEIVVSPV